MNEGFQSVSGRGDSLLSRFRGAGLGTCPIASIPDVRISGNFAFCLGGGSGGIFAVCIFSLICVETPSAFLAEALAFFIAFSIRSLSVSFLCGCCSFCGTCLTEGLRGSFGALSLLDSVSPPYIFLARGAFVDLLRLSY